MSSARHVLPSLVDDTPGIAVIHGGCNDLGYKNKEALTTDDIINAILDIFVILGNLCQCQGVKDFFISSLMYRKNNFQNNKVNMVNSFACDLLGFHFIDNTNIARNHLAGDGIHLNYAGSEVLLENIAFSVTATSSNTEQFDQHFSVKHMGRGNGNCSKTDPCDTVEHLNSYLLVKIFLAN